ncbi:carboxypeptidase regulatory-like domain-containing protein [Microbulbifer thermotolerans]|uniref:carboxypeptidase regulatory-like domain-containing protein n=1 Tax=Microbulbifer thermotolerans TaxID=252514 RepID=UPI0008F1CABB|nr:carboxypeptidase regulatory-like domain-containing protein [Microbulbifer thermotolerans]MCX2779233.1 carboxypeptidase regulatory-like domain-containing protein [Microbulbifer thermotolerans]MCX2781665.1 carboxypeptidase regulatory-like domain-containing protein [Microbulbifer thermotolerans]MCX2793537.1 carboxypeptidase regulatory-like domain-containing protein [Microbulbifer thermotolerans]MCX2803657.1 carboxypeptidase regulatory-like domain-containing protein [Microbulbifer thermotolerans
MFQKNKLSNSMAESKGSAAWGRAAFLAVGTLFSATVMAQQVGTIEGQVSLGDDIDATGVTVTATSNVMPRPRTVVTDDDGEFKLPMLIPGIYTVTFTSEDGATRTVKAEVLLDQVTVLDVNLLAPVAETLEELVVTGEMVTVGGNSSLSDAIGAEILESLPVGQDYRDLMKLAPGVQYSQNSIRGPNAGGSGQDNVYKFDGVNVTLPMFGTLSAEPSTQDVEQFSVERGGARAIGFNRSGGMTVNTISKSGTNEFKGSVEYRVQPSGLREEPKDGVDSDVTQTWMTANVGGPLIEDQLFFYGSYYGPREDGDNKETAYGSTKDYSSERDEYYGKLTYAPIDSVLLNAAYRTSERVNEGASIGEYEADSVSVGEEANQDILTLDGSWLVNDDLTVSFQYSDYSLETAGVPDTTLGVQPVIGDSLDLDNLDQMGYLTVPTVNSAYSSAYNTLAQQLIDQYGYLDDSGTLTGGGGVGAYYQFNVQNFYRESFELAVDYNFEIGSTSHELHVGYQWSEGEEELARLSNGWGLISLVDGANDADAPDNALFLAKTQQMSFVGADGSTVPSIKSYTETHNFEINDSIAWGDFIFDVGFLISQDTLYGQGLKEDGSTVSGYVAAPGHKYEMYQVDWEDMIQPRLGVSWAYNGVDTIFASFAQYNPAATSLARAASWDRNSAALIEVYFDDEGNYISSSPRASSSGKLFADDLDPRRVDELTIGTTKEFDNGISLRSHIRYREGSHFWEDTPNTARLYGCYGENNDMCVPSDIAAKGLYIDNLDEMLAQIGSGSTYVIAELDDAYTKYLEFSLEASWMGERTYLNASYTHSRYTGNFDQDNTAASNDLNTFIGSSNIGDGIGRQVWDYKDGTLSGDRPHLLKLFGQYTLDWNANIGAYLVYQSGQPWETWNGSIYGFTSSTNRYAEKAGSHRSPSHWQMDLSYTQNFNFYGDYLVKFRADIFNVFDKQTGYNIDPIYNSETYGDPRSYYAPRRVQLSLAVDF